MDTTEWLNNNNNQNVPSGITHLAPHSAAPDPSEVIHTCLIAGLGRIPKLWLSSNLKCVTHRPPHQNSLLESGREDLRQQRKGGRVCSEVVLSLPFDSRGLTGCFFANGRHRSLWVSFVSRRGWTGEPRTGTGKQEVEDLVILQGRARTDMGARQCLEGPKNVLPCGQQQARSQEPGARKEQGQAMVHAVGGGTGQCCPSRVHHRVCWFQSLTWLNTQLWAAGSGDAEVVADVGKEGFYCSYCKQRGPGVLGMETCDWWGTVVPRTAHATFLHPPHQAVSPQACCVGFPTRHWLTEKCVNPVTPASQAFGKLLDRG